jgi:hypothetical protein
VGVLQDNFLDRPYTERLLSLRALVREHAQESVRFDRAVPVPEPVERVLGVAEVPVERPVVQLEQVLHRRALAAPAAPRARQAAAGPRSDKNGHVEVLAICLFPEWKFPSVGLKMSRVPSLKDLAFSAIPSRVPSLKQLARAAVAANRPPLPAHTLAIRQSVDAPWLIRRLYEAIFRAVAGITYIPGEILALLTPHMASWRRAPWKFDIPRPSSLRLRGNPGDSDMRPSEDQPRDQPYLEYVWNWNTHAIDYETRWGDLRSRTRTRERWDRHNIPRL